MGQIGSGIQVSASFHMLRHAHSVRQELGVVSIVQVGGVTGVGTENSREHTCFLFARTEINTD